MPEGILMTVPYFPPGSSPYVFSPTTEACSLRRRCFQLLFSSSGPQVPRMRWAGQWNSRTGRPRHQPHSSWGRTWRRVRRRAAKRSGLCKRSSSRTGMSGLQIRNRRQSLKGWGWCWPLTIGWGTDCGWGHQRSCYDPVFDNEDKDHLSINSLIHTDKRT